MSNVISMFKTAETISFTFPTDNMYLIRQCKNDMKVFSEKDVLYYIEQDGFTTLFFLK